MQLEAGVCEFIFKWEAVVKEGKLGNTISFRNKRILYTGFLILHLVSGCISYVNVDKTFPRFVSNLLESLTGNTYEGRR